MEQHNGLLSAQKTSIAALVSYCILLVFYLIVIQDLVASRMAITISDNTYAKAFLFFKEFIVFCLAIVTYPFIGGRSEIKLALLFFLITIFYVLISPLPLGMALQDFRPYCLIVASFITGNYLGKHNRVLDGIIKSLIYLTIFIMMFGFVEHYLFPKKMFKEFFPLVQIATKVKDFSDIEFYRDGLPGNFINSDAGKRMVGPFGDPLYMGYFLIFCLDIIFAYWFFVKRRLNGTLVILLIGLYCVFLGQVRAIWIGSAVSIGVLFFNKKYLKYLIPVFFLVVFFVILKRDLIITTVQSMYSGGGSSRNHILAYYKGIPKIMSHPFGTGVGTHGSFATRSTTGEFYDAEGFENAYINLALEIGILPTIFIVLVSVYLIKHSRMLILKVKSISITEQIILLSGFLLNVQFVIAGLLSPHIMTARIVIPFWFLNGACIAVIRKFKRSGQLEL